MSTEAMARVGRLLGSPVASATPVARGYSNNARWLVTLADGRSAFVKQAVDRPTTEWLRREHHAYAHLDGPWRPEVLAWEDGDESVLVLEDLSACAWPPPWTADRIEAVKAALAGSAAHPAPPDAGRALHGDYVEGGWPAVAREPAPLLGLGLCSAEWLDRALPALLEAADPAVIDGDRLCHLDVRSDNLCFRDGQAVLIDWNHARAGNPGVRPRVLAPEPARRGWPGAGRGRDRRPGRRRARRRLLRLAGRAADHPPRPARPGHPAGPARGRAALGGARARAARARASESGAMNRAVPISPATPMAGCR